MKNDVLLAPGTTRMDDDADSSNRVRTILVLGTGQYLQLLGSIVIGGYFLLF